MRAFEYAIHHSPTKSIDVTALTAGVIGEPGSFVDKVLEGREKRCLEPPKLQHPGLDVNLMGNYNCAYVALWYMSLDTKIEEDVRDNKAVEGVGFFKSLFLVSSTVAYTDVPNFADYHTSTCEYAISTSNVHSSSKSSAFPFPWT